MVLQSLATLVRLVYQVVLEVHVFLDFPVLPYVLPDLVHLFFQASQQDPEDLCDQVLPLVLVFPVGHLDQDRQIHLLDLEVQVCLLLLFLLGILLALAFLVHPSFLADQGVQLLRLYQVHLVSL